MDYTEEKYHPVLIKLASDIDQMDYYQILNLPLSCTKVQIKKQYYGMSRALHPDKFYQLENDELKQAVKKVFKRVTESYTILKDDKKRKLYTEQLSGPDRQSHLRFSEKDEQQLSTQNVVQGRVAQTPQGQKCYAAYLTEFNRKNWDSALRHLQSAMIFETGNTRLAALKAELEAKREQADEGETPS